MYVPLRLFGLAAVGLATPSTAPKLHRHAGAVLCRCSTLQGLTASQIYQVVWFSVVVSLTTLQAICSSLIMYIMLSSKFIRLT